MLSPATAGSGWMARREYEAAGIHRWFFYNHTNCLGSWTRERAGDSLPSTRTEHRQRVAGSNLVPSDLARSSGRIAIAGADNDITGRYRAEFRGSLHNTV